MPARWLAPLPLLLLAAFLLARSAGGPARGDELLVNGGFEDGIAGWDATDGQLYPSSYTRSGAGAAELSSTQPRMYGVYQAVDVSAGQTYEFAGWVRFDDIDVEKVFLRIEWYDAANNLLSWDDSLAFTTPATDYRPLTTGTRQAPPGAATARVTVRAHALGEFSLYLDDLTFTGSAPSVTPTPAISTTPTLTASATPHGSPPASITPPPTQTAGPTATPRIVTPTPLAEPAVFAELVNGGFEEARDDGSAYGWRKIGGELARTDLASHGGGWALLLRSGTDSTKWAYQAVSVRGGAWYAASGYARPGPGVEAFLRVSWYESADTTGEAISYDDSPPAATVFGGAFQPLTTGPVLAPGEARSARVRLMLRPPGAAEAEAYFDDIAFARIDPPAPSPLPTPPPTSTPTPLPTRTPVESRTETPPATTAPTATTAPPTPTPTASPSDPPSETPSSAPTAGPTQQPEPSIFPLLTNGGFEEARDDGTPYAWHKSGGAMAVTDASPVEGEYALEFSSASASTKWVYQALAVTAGGWYEASGIARVAGQGEAFLRVSWYASDDGAGEQIASVDSADIADGDGFRSLSTGPVQAPLEAGSAKVRLLLRPGSAASAVAYFDAVQFNAVTEPSELPASPPSPSPAPAPGARSTEQAGNRQAGNDADPTQAALGANQPPLHLANVRPDPAAPRSAATRTGDDSPDWPVAAAALTSGLGFAALAAYEITRRRRDAGR